MPGGSRVTAMLKLELLPDVEAHFTSGPILLGPSVHFRRNGFGNCDRC